MLPRVFTHNFQDPMQSIFTYQHRLQQPLLASLSYKGSFGCGDDHDMSCDIEVVTEQTLGEDVVYVLPQLPTLSRTSEINYKIRVSNIFPECRDAYIGGLFSNSLRANIKNFDKYDFLYIPIFHEYLENIECGQSEDIVISMRGHTVRQAGIIEPSYVNGSLIFKNQKYPSRELAKKQENRALHSCIFR